jgi:DNA-binding response OmpR family regulator
LNGIASDASPLHSPAAMTAAAHTILVVDDDDSMRMLCRVNLELEGYRVLEAATIEAAQELLRGSSVDVVLLDVHVGAGDGFMLLKDIRDERVALFTGSYEVDSERRAQVDAVLSKPFTLSELSATVAELAPS